MPLRTWSEHVLQPRQMIPVMNEAALLGRLLLPLALGTTDEQDGGWTQPLSIAEILSLY